MLLGNHWGPCGFGRICVRCLCNEVSIQSQSKFPFVNSSFSYTMCSPNRVLALVPTTAFYSEDIWLQFPSRATLDPRALEQWGWREASASVLWPDSHKATETGKSGAGKFPSWGCTLKVRRPWTKPVW